MDTHLIRKYERRRDPARTGRLCMAVDCRRGRDDCLKGLAYWLTGSVGLLSDAVESLVNLAGAVVALTMIQIAARPPDEEHAYGFTKAEYFSSGFEGAMIFLAAVAIGIAAVERLLAPQPLEQLGMGLAVSAAATVLNLVVGRC